MRMRRAAACLLVLAALAAGCAKGSDDDAGTAKTKQTTGSDRQADEAAARKMLLTITDFPTGWKADPASGSQGGGGSSSGAPDDERIQTQLADCLHVDPSQFGDKGHPKAESPDFSNADDTASVEVTFTPSDGDASRSLAILQRPEAPGCVSQVFKEVFSRQMQGEDVPEGIQVGEPVVDRAPLRDLGDDAAAFRVTIPISAAGVQLSAYLDMAFVRVGRIGITALFESTGKPFDAELSQRLIQTVVDRAPEG